MGCDFVYSGSCSYPRFEKEMSNLAILLGAKPLVSVINPYKDSNNLSEFISGMMGTTYKDQQDISSKYTWNSHIPEYVQHWFDAPYDENYYTVENTANIASYIFSHLTADQVKQYLEDNSTQILYELNQLWLYEDVWNLS